MYRHAQTYTPQRRIPKEVIKLIICWLKGGNVVVKTEDIGMGGLSLTVFLFLMF